MRKLYIILIVLFLFTGLASADQAPIKRKNVGGAEGFIQTNGVETQ